MKKQHLLSFALFLGCFFPISLYSQVQVLPFVNSHQQFFNGGSPCNGCQLFTYSAGTTTPLTTYSDSLGTVPNTNPVVLASDGSATIYLQLASYKFILQTAAGASIWTQDNVTANNIGQTLSSLTISGAGPVTINTATAATSGANQSGPSSKLCGNFWNGAASAADCWTWQDVLGTGTNPTSTYTLGHAGSSGLSTVDISSLSLKASPYSIDGWLFVDGSKYTTFANALAGLPTNGGEVRIPPDRNETFTSQIDIGSATHPAQSVLGGNDILTCNVTGGTNDCLDIHNASAFVGQSTGSTATRTGGSVLNLAATANVVNVVNSPEGANLGGQSFLGLENMQIDNANAGTVSGAMVNLQGITNLITVRDVTVSQCHTIGWNVTSTANSGLGPLTLDNDWGECDANAGGRPLVITANTAKAVENVTVNGGAYVHPGVGHPAVEVNGQNTSDILRSTLFLGTFTEDLVNAANIGTKVVDATATTIIGGGHGAINGTGVGIDISENTSGLTRGVVAINYHCDSPGVTCLNNHITGTTLGTSSTTIPLYIYGGNTGVAIGARPVTFENIEFDINNGSGARLAQFPVAGNPYFSNQADADSIYIFDGGLTAAQNVIFCLQDRSTSTATCKWKLEKASGGNFVLIDGGTGLIRSAWTAGAAGTSELNSAGATSVNLNVRSGLGTGGTAFGDGAGNTVATMSSTGNLSKYASVATADYGVPAIQGTPQHLTGQVGNLGATNLYAAAPPAGVYRVCFDAFTTTSGTGTTMTVSIGWTDAGGAKTFTSATWALNSLTITGYVDGCKIINSSGAANITVSTTGTIGTSAFAIDAMAERMK